MGIFANRTIKKDEELTFNYNVDRYGYVRNISFGGHGRSVFYLGMRHNHAIVANQIVWVSLAEKHRRISLP